MVVSVILLSVLLKFGECQLYHYGNDAGDNNTISDGTRVGITKPIQYLGKYQHNVYISDIGVLGFTDQTYFIEHQWRTNPEEANNPFIAPYYFNAAQPTSTVPGKVYYRLETNETFLNSLGGYLETSVVGAASQGGFMPQAAIIVTWKNVIDKRSAPDDCLDEEGNNICDKTNTFQLVLVYNDVQTYAIFNYEKMDVPSQSAYQAGMNGGLNGGWTDVYCRDDCNNFDYSQLPNTAASDVSGRFIYKVSEEIIVRGGCLTTASGNIEAHPTTINSFGGEMVTVSGICITPSTKVQCKFGVVEPVDAMYISPMISRCLVPRLTARGLMKLEVLVDGANSGLSTEVNAAYAGRAEIHIKTSLGWNETDAETLSVSWDHNFLSTDQSATVDVILVGYRETEDAVIWKPLDVLGTNVRNSDGQFQFIPSEHRCSGDDCTLFEIAQVEVRLNRQYWTATNINGYFSSFVKPLGWYFLDYMNEEYGKDWSTIKCLDWNKADKLEMGWEEELLDCPCTLHQAITDFGRWQPDGGCNMYTGSVCTYHIGAVHCVRAFKPTESGSGNQCCYGPDGNVRYAADSYQGSTPDRGHDWGAAPYNKPDYVPSLSHWKHDVITFYYCCLWVGYEECDYYMDQRSTRDCKNYKPPQTGIVFGDPHIITFDGFGYNAVGKGEYWLVKTENFNLQGRFDKIPSALNETTALTGISMKETGSSIVEIRLSPSDKAHSRALTVLLDDKIRMFNARASRWQDLKGLSIINADDSGGKQDNFTIIMDSGVGVQVAAKNGLLHVIAVLPQEFKGKTKGLLGSWTDEESSQLKLPDDTVVDKSSSTEQLYNNFISKWLIPTDESMFKYPMNTAEFHPLFGIPPLPEDNTPEKISKCLNHPICLYDYKATGNTLLAVDSKMAEEWFRLIQSYQVAVGSCGLLDVPRSTKDNYNYSIGSAITVTGCRKGLLSGETSYSCTKNVDGSTSWKPEVTAKCTGAKLYSSRANGLQNMATLRTILVLILMHVLYILNKHDC